MTLTPCSEKAEQGTLDRRRTTYRCGVNSPKEYFQSMFARELREPLRPAKESLVFRKLSRGVQGRSCLPRYPSRARHTCGQKEETIGRASMWKATTSNREHSTVQLCGTERYSLSPPGLLVVVTVKTGARRVVVAQVEVLCLGRLSYLISERCRDIDDNRKGGFRLRGGAGPLKAQSGRATGYVSNCLGTAVLTDLARPE